LRRKRGSTNSKIFKMQPFHCRSILLCASSFLLCASCCGISPHPTARCT